MAERSGGSPLLNMMAALSDTNKADLRQRFKEDPQAVMNEYGVPEAQQTLVKNAVELNRHTDLTRALNDELFGTAEEPNPQTCIISLC